MRIVRVGFPVPAPTSTGAVAIATTGAAAEGPQECSPDSSGRPPATDGVLRTERDRHAAHRPICKGRDCISERILPTSGLQPVAQLGS